jgi:hypothetical protein
MIPPAGGAPAVIREPLIPVQQSPPPLQEAPVQIMPPVRLGGDTPQKSEPRAAVSAVRSEWHEFLRRTPTAKLEMRFSAMFEKATSSCQQLVSHELSSILRPKSVKLRGFNFDVFCSELTRELDSIIDYSSVKKDAPFGEVARKVGIAVDEQIHPVVDRLRTSSAEESSANEKRRATLRALLSELDMLRAAFKSGTDQIIQGLEGKRDRGISSHEREVGKSRGCARRLQQLSYQRAELEKQISQMKIDIDASLHSLRTLESERQTFHDEELPSYLNGRSRVDRVLTEISDLRHQISEEEGAQIALVLEGVVGALAHDRNQLTGDIHNCETATRHLTLAVADLRRARSTTARRTAQTYRPPWTLGPSAECT